MRRFIFVLTMLTLLLTGIVAFAQGQTVHVVQPGENLYRISLRYNTTMAAIAQANGITNYNLIFAGSQLIIPTGGTTPPPPATPQPGGANRLRGRSGRFPRLDCAALQHDGDGDCAGERDYQHQYHLRWAAPEYSNRRHSAADGNTTDRRTAYRSASGTGDYLHGTARRHAGADCCPLQRYRGGDCTGERDHQPQLNLRGTAFDHPWRWTGATPDPTTRTARANAAASNRTCWRV